MDHLGPRCRCAAPDVPRGRMEMDANPCRCLRCEKAYWYAERPQEVCLCAAVLLRDGRVIRGHRHDDCIHNVAKRPDADALEIDEQGFLTSHGRFVGREVGARLMREAGHVSADTGKPFTGTLLMSEDLY